MRLFIRCLCLIFIGIHPLFSMDMKKVRSAQPRQEHGERRTRAPLTESAKEIIADNFMNVLDEYYKIMGEPLDSLFSIKHHILHENKLILTIPTQEEDILPSGFGVDQTDFLGKVIPILSQLTWVKDLTISWKNPEGINLILQYMPHINTLDLSYNSLSRVPEGVTKLRRLKILNLSSNYFTTFPDDILSTLKNIKTLYLIRNPLLMKSYKDEEGKHLGRKDLERDARVCTFDEKTRSMLESFGPYSTPPLSYYLSDLHTFSKMIFSDLPGVHIQNDSPSEPVYALDKIIYNASGYPNFPKDPLDLKGGKTVYPP